MPALPTPTKTRQITRNSHPGTIPSGPGVNTLMPVAREITIDDQMNSVRRPIRSPSQPQSHAPGEAPSPAPSRRAPQKKRGRHRSLGGEEKTNRKKKKKKKPKK